MTRQRILEDPKYSSYLDLSVWPKVNTTSFSSKKRKTFYMRKQAVELYIDGRTTGKDIYKITGIQPKEVRYFVKRCLEENILTGTIYGYSALIPNKRIKDYSRSSLPTDSDNNKGMSGAFKLLLETYPSIKNTIDNAYLKKNKNQIHEPVIKIKNIFKLFIRECRSIGIKLNQYPFITKDMGKRSVERYCEKLHLENLIAASKRDGEKYSRYMASTGKGSKNTIITRPYQRVQFDAHVVDLIMSITANTVEGYEVTKTINRINLLTIIDEATRVILGYHLSYNQNYSSTDVLQCIKNAISPRMSEPTFTIPGLKYSSIGGFPSTKFPECRWAVWDELLFDNAKANLSQIVKEKLQEFVGSFTNAGPVSMPERRGLIERFFGLLEENGFQRLPNTTGSNSKDPKRQNPEKKAIKYQITEQHLEELLDVLIAEYNAAPHGGLNYLSPLETLEQRIQKGELIRTMDENMREDFAILTIQASRIVRGKFKSGVSPHINYEGVVYRSDVLVKSPDLIGTKLDLLVNTEDLRAVKAFLPDGSELGLLQATGKWFYTKHSLRTRKTINSLRSRKLIHFTNANDPILIYYKYLEEEVSKGKKASGNKLIELRREIEDKTAEYMSRERIDGERDHLELINNDNISKKEQNIKSKPFNKTISY